MNRHTMYFYQTQNVFETKTNEQAHAQMCLNLKLMNRHTMYFYQTQNVFEMYFYQAHAQMCLKPKLMNRHMRKCF